MRRASWARAAIKVFDGGFFNRRTFLLAFGKTVARVRSLALNPGGILGVFAKLIMEH